MEEDINRQSGAGKRIKQAVFYAVLFLSGFLISVFAREGADAFKMTANIARQSLGEAWPSSGSQKVIATIPLDGAGKQIGTAAKSKNSKTSSAKQSGAVPESKNVYADKPLPPPPVKSQESAVPATSSDQIKTESVASEETEPVPLEPTPASPTPPSQTSPASQNNSPSPVAPVPPAASAGKVLFYEIQISGGAGLSANDFIRIYNPNNFTIDASGWKLKKKSSSGKEYSISPATFPNGTTIAPGGTLIWANNKDNFAATLGAQLTSASTISPDNSIAIFDFAGNIIDAVAWGEGSNQFMEGSAYPANPEGGQILRRRAENQILKDTDNNAADFSV